MNSIVRGVIIVLVLFAIWSFIVWFFKTPAYILPSPYLVLLSLWHNLGLIADQAVTTMIEALSGLICSFIFGCIGAICIAYFKPARVWFLPILIISQALPTFAIAPVFVIWLGYGIASKIAITILMLFFPITSAFYDGLVSTPRSFMDLAKTMNGIKWQIMTKIQIPAALPALGVGLRVATVYSMMGAIIGEWVGASKGLGFLMLNANSRMEISLVFATLFVIVAFTLLLYFIVDNCLKRFIFW